MNLFKNCEKVRVMTSSKKIKARDLTGIVKDFIYERSLKSLNDIEAADLILSYVERHITRKELEMEYGYEDYTIHKYLQEDKKVQICCGFPMYLEKLAQALNNNDYS